MSERNGIEIDYCPKCRGVWLDRGELDKIIEANSMNTQTIATPQVDNNRHAPQEYRNHDDWRYEDGHRYQKKHKRESFLGDLFDF